MVVIFGSVSMDEIVLEFTVVVFISRFPAFVYNSLERDEMMELI